MPTKIESAGTYIGVITESGLGLSKKNSYPQAILRLAPTKKFVETKEEIEHFQKQGLLADGQAGYVDWSAFGEEQVAFLVLFKSASEFSKDTAMMNYEQIQLATGWDGTEFDSFTNGTFVGKEVLFRVSEKKPYTDPDTGKTFGGDGSLEVSWIDNKDASPQRQLKSVDADQVKNLNALLKGMGKPAAKPVASAAKPAAAPVASPSVPTAAPSTQPAASASAAPSASKPAPKRKTKTAEAAASTPPAAPATADVPPAETNQADAWAFVNSPAVKGTTEDQKVEESWIDACSTVLGDRDESQATGADWAKVRDLVVSKIAA